jgi:uncharacterized protein YndB with AHSA1/START domain
MAYPFDNWLVGIDDSNQLVVKAAEGDTPMLIASEEVRREVEIDASPDEVWEAIATEEGRERWLEPDPDREIRVETSDQPERMVWWWWREDEAPRRVELTIVGVPAGTRVVVVESAPAFPLTLLARSFAYALA